MAGSILFCGLFLVHSALPAGIIPSQYNIFLQNPRADLQFDKNVIYGSGNFDGKFNSLYPVSPPLPPQQFFGVSSYPQYGFTGTGVSQPSLPLPPATQDPRLLGCGSAPANCVKSRYRSYDGSCNNLRNPILGVPQSPYTRLLPQNYGDGISTPTLAKSGKPLPGARIVSLVFYPDVPIEDPKWTLAAMQYGQIITHDMSLAAGTVQAQPSDTKCCTDDGQLLPLSNSPEHCFPIILPEDDPAHSRSNVRCMNFVRTITDRDRNCVGGYQPAEQLTAVNHYLDLSIVYGNTDQINQQVREFQGGRLRVEIRGGQEWPPRNNNATGVCTLQDPSEACYFAGDTRANQNPQLTLLQIILLREHNRVANALFKLNPHWDDETIFQEARRIVIAEHQHITYYEWIPIFLGLQNSLRNRLVYNVKGFVNDYNEDVNPTVINEHATAAFRYFHSLIAGHLDLVTEQRDSFSNIRMSDWFNRPVVLEQGSNFADLTRGLGTQPQLDADPYHDSEITQFLFRAGRQFGADLKATDIQRNRDHGLASYNDYRSFCGLPKAHSFEDFLDVISQDNVKKLASLYESPDDVDLTVGGSLEAHVPGTLSGPTFLCILTEQFYRTRAGDRFFYENGDPDSGFTLEQLNEIRKASISRFFCDNGADVRAMQPRGFERISQNNIVVPCESLPFVDLSLWKDISVTTSGLGAEQPFSFPDNEFLLKK